MADEDKGLVAGRPPAVKAGGMRIVQHKTPSTERPAKDPVEVIGLSNPAPNVNTGEVVQSSSASKHSEHSVEASQVAHAQKPVVQIPPRPVNHIQQPRKC
ncbi:death-associated protein 1 [Topomyia yanbarensis]|uniref:death-associated protein 1 n=1 Tax=Topomyia yanbarensis TaxID=2498891 RepID=UPI00273B6683|nr:death-associated protein 1 [Topomyia yanbarensis]XP_058831767.1 death-associated protein 1 [Topomyia yanbarensis]